MGEKNLLKQEKLCNKDNKQMYGKPTVWSECILNLNSFRWNFYDVLKGTTVAKSNQENLHLLGVKFNSESLPTLFFMMKHFGYYYVFFAV